MSDIKLHFFVGISASGKTTKAYEMFGKNSVIVHESVLAVLLTSL